MADVVFAALVVGYCRASVGLLLPVGGGLLVVLADRVEPRVILASGGAKLVELIVVVE